MSKSEEPVWLSPQPPYDPIEWTPENEHLFLYGAVLYQTMTRAEFERRYPTAKSVPKF